MDFDFKMKDNRELAEEGENFMKEYIQLYLEHVLPKFPIEGVTSVRQHLLSEATLANISLHLGTKDIILAPEYPVDNTILANTFKAIVGALLKSSGQERAAHFVRDFVITQLQGQDVNEYWHIADPWAMLTSLAGAEVEPRLVGAAGGRSLLACFRVGLYVDRKMVASGFGETVAIAKEMAARAALRSLFGTAEHLPPPSFRLPGLPAPARASSRYQITAT